MKPNYTPLKKLTDKSKGAKLKVQVVHKGLPTTSPKKHRYQRLVFRDEEGTTMKGTLFENDIEMYEHALQRNGEYELTDVTVKPIPEQFRSRADEEYQVNLGGRMKVKALDVSGCAEEAKYRLLANVPTIYKPTDPLIDVVAAIVYVGSKREEKYAGFVRPIREIILANQTMSHPMKLIAKDRFAYNDASDFLTNWQEGYQVIGFTAIRPNTYGGLTLSTTMSTAFNDHPRGAALTALNEWKKDNSTLLDDWRAKAMLIYSESPSKDVLPLASIINKKATTIWQDEAFWTSVYLPNFRVEDIYSYLGCDICGKKASGEPGTRFFCGCCEKKDAPIESKLVMNTDLVDGASTLRVTGYTAVVEQILGITATDYVAMKKQGQSPVTEKIELVKRDRFLFRICPNYELSTGNVLKWVATNAERYLNLEKADDDTETSTAKEKKQPAETKIHSMNKGAVTAEYEVAVSVETQASTQTSAADSQINAKVLPDNQLTDAGHSDQGCYAGDS